MFFEQKSRGQRQLTPAKDSLQRSAESGSHPEIKEAYTTAYGWIAVKGKLPEGHLNR